MKLIGGTEMKRLSDNAVEIIHDIHTNGSDHQNEFLPLLDAEARLFDAASRLALYEEAGLEPEKCRKLAEAKKEGRLVVLPCKLGETVYANFCIRGDYLREKDKPYPCKVVFIGLSSEPFLHIQFKNKRIFPVEFSKIGKTVFLTREEAEAALEAQKGGEE